MSLLLIFGTGNNGDAYPSTIVLSASVSNAVAYVNKTVSASAINLQAVVDGVLAKVNNTANPSEISLSVVTGGASAAFFIEGVVANVGELTVSGVGSGIVFDNVSATPAEINVSALTSLPIKTEHQFINNNIGRLTLTSIHSYAFPSAYSFVAAPSIQPTNAFTKGLLLTWFMRVTFGTTVQYSAPSGMTPVTGQGDWGLSLIAKADITAVSYTHLTLPTSP
jgi:hypothetical protein